MQRLLPGLRQCVKSMRFLTVSSTASCSCAAYAAPSHKESRWFRVTSAMAAGLQIPSHSALARPCKMMRAVLIPRLRCGVLVFYGSRARELDFNNLRADDGNLNPNMQPPAQVGELLRVSTICEMFPGCYCTSPCSSARHVSGYCHQRNRRDLVDRLEPSTQWSKHHGCS